MIPCAARWPAKIGRWFYCTDPRGHGGIWHHARTTRGTIAKRWINRRPTGRTPAHG